MMNGGTKRERYKQFNDPIHGHIRIYGICLQVLDTPEFQRLREIKQLACVHYVFTSANHTRFEHSLGVCHLARKAVQYLQVEQPELEITRDDIDAVTLAGLCHDIGHGAFSHALDNEILPAVAPNYSMKHEERGILLLDHVVEKNGLNIRPNILSLAKDLMISRHRPQVPGKKAFLWDIVCNERSGIDVDKFDYLARDAMFTGVKTSFDHDRIMCGMRVIDDEVCYKHNEADLVYELFTARIRMHKVVYTHKTAKAVEYMIVDALKAAADELNLRAMMRNLADFCKLDDTVLRRIETSTSTNGGILEAQRIIRLLRTRKTYHYVNDCLVPKEFTQDSDGNFKFIDVTSRDLVECLPEGGAVKVDEKDIIVQNLKIDFGRGNKNPVDSVHFYEGRAAGRKFPVKSDKISNMISQHYNDVIVRIFFRGRDQKKEEALAAAFEELQHRKWRAIQQKTPQKSNLKRPRDSESDSPSGTARSLNFSSQESH